MVAAAAAIKMISVNCSRDFPIIDRCQNRKLQYTESVSVESLVGSSSLLYAEDVMRMAASWYNHRSLSFGHVLTVVGVLLDVDVALSLDGFKEWGRS